MSRILAIDPGAERLGWAVIDSKIEGELEPKVYASGIWGLIRGDDEEYQVYKLRLIGYWAYKSPLLLDLYRPTTLVSETQPAVGGGNFIAATQSELAKTAITILQAWAFQRALRVVQIGATTVKTAIGGSKGASKAKVRNGVASIFPDMELELRRESSSKPAIWDRSDAIAIGLAHLGVKVK